MPERLAVRQIDGPRLVEQVRNDLLEAIHRTDLLPGQAFSLRSVAEERRVRPDMLTMLLRRDEQEGLLEIRGDLAMVAPLDPGSLMSAFRVARLMQPVVVPKACELASPVDLERLDQLVPVPELTELDYDQYLIRASMKLLVDLLAPGMTRVDHQVLHRIHATSRRYANLAARHLAGHSYDSNFNPYLRLQQEALELLRKGRLRAAIALERRICDRQMAFAEASLDLPGFGSDDQAIAEVIPIRAGVHPD